MKPLDLTRILPAAACACALACVALAWAGTGHAVDSLILAAVAALPGRRDGRDALHGDVHFRAAVDLSPDAILMHANGRIVYANAAAARLLNAGDPAEIVGRAACDVVSSEFRDLARSRIERLQRGANWDAETNPRLW